jgi:hypothetical protein
MMKSPIMSVLLLALCSWLGWAAYEESNQPIRPSAASRSGDAVAVTTGDRAKPKIKSTTFVFPPLETLGEIVSRPLFNDSRRPITVEEPTPEAKQRELNLMLSGIVIDHTGKIAHLRSATDKQTKALSEGDKIGDWQIQSILPNSVVLRSGGRVETLFMQKPGAAAAKPSKRRDTTRAKRRKRRQQQRRSRRRGE